MSQSINIINNANRLGNDHAATSSNIKYQKPHLHTVEASTTSPSSSTLHQQHHLLRQLCFRIWTTNDASLWLSSFIVSLKTTNWQRYHRRAGFLELESAIVSSTNINMGKLNSLICRPSASTLSLTRDAPFSSTHIVDYNLILHSKKIDIPYVVAMVQHQHPSTIRSFLQHYHQRVFHDIFITQVHLQPKWSKWLVVTTTAIIHTTNTRNNNINLNNSNWSIGISSSWLGTSPTVVIAYPPSGSSLVIKFKRCNDEPNIYVEMDNDSANNNNR